MADSSRQMDPVRIILLVLAVIIGLPLLMMALFVPVGMMGVWGFGMHGGPGMVGGVGAIELLVIALMGLVPLLVIVGGGYLLYRTVRSDGSHRRGEDPALSELRLAYARGDLSEEEYEERRERLTDDRIESR